AVARELFKAGFQVKVLTRNPTSLKCQELKKRCIECVKGNLNEIDTYREYVRNAYGVFSVQTFEKGVKREIEQEKPWQIFLLSLVLNILCIHRWPEQIFKQVFLILKASMKLKNI